MDDALAARCLLGVVTVVLVSRVISPRPFYRHGRSFRCPLFCVRCFFFCAPLSSSDVTGIDPYITATVREVRDSAGEAPEGGEEESNDVVSSDVKTSSTTMACVGIGVGVVGIVSWRCG